MFEAPTIVPTSIVWDHYRALFEERDFWRPIRNSLIVALREVEDSLLDLKTLANSRQALEQALASAEVTKKLAQERFDKGLTNYLDVVDADRTVLQARLLLSQTDARQRITFAVLAKSLGGGWSGK